MTALRCDVKVMYTWGQALALAAVWGLVGLAFADRLGGAPADVLVWGLRAMLEVALPPLALAAVAHAAVLEWEERTVELTLSYPGGGTKLLGRRLAVGGALFVLIGSVAVAAFWALAPVIGQAGLLEVARAAGTVSPPALFVAAVGLFASVATKSHAGGLGAGMLVWGLDLALPGKLTGQLYLFQASRPLDGVALADNRAWLVAAAAATFVAAFALWSRRERALR